MQAEKQYWLPAALLHENDDVRLRWMLSDAQPFREPFFHDDINRLKYTFAVNRQRPFVQTPVSTLAYTRMEQEPDLLVFHVSRCGSTLLTQLLGLDEQITTLAEVPLFDELLALPHSHDRRTLLRAAAQLLRRGTKKLVIKCDSWHLLHYEFLRSCFPDTPVVFLYRHPGEVWQSQCKRSGIQAIPGYLRAEQLPGFSLAGNSAIAAGPYFGKLLELFFEIMLQHAAAKNVLLLQYSRDALSFVLPAAAHAGISPNAFHLEQMKQRAGFNAKNPGEVFSEKLPDVQVPDFLEAALGLYRKLVK
jgi:hypothetical protein